MAWLLHEPRLVAKVPVFCIIGVRPLLRNPQAPLSVSVGAVHLLTHLHGRLEVREAVHCWLCPYTVTGTRSLMQFSGNRNRAALVSVTQFQQQCGTCVVTAADVCVATE
jgi:hypothetical protein